VLFGVNSIVSIGLNIAKQTRWISASIAIAAALSIVLNLLLIPRIGFIGAALATFVSYALLAWLTAVFGERYYSVRWDWPRVAGAITVAIILAAAALLGPDHPVWRFGTIAIYPLALIALRIVSTNELRAARNLFRRGGIDDFVDG
jgi:O-antigen/teichoic acid export membrane protein